MCLFSKLVISILIFLQLFYEGHSAHRRWQSRTAGLIEDPNTFEDGTRLSDLEDDLEDGLEDDLEDDLENGLEEDFKEARNVLGEQYASTWRKGLFSKKKKEQFETYQPIWSKQPSSSRSASQPSSSRSASQPSSLRSASQPAVSSSQSPDAVLSSKMYQDSDSERKGSPLPIKLKPEVQAILKELEWEYEWLGGNDIEQPQVEQLSSRVSNGNQKASGSLSRKMSVPVSSRSMSPDESSSVKDSNAESGRSKPAIEIEPKVTRRHASRTSREECNKVDAPLDGSLTRDRLISNNENQLFRQPSLEHRVDIHSGYQSSLEKKKAASSESKTGLTKLYDHLMEPISQTEFSIYIILHLFSIATAIYIFMMDPLGRFDQFKYYGN